MRTLAAMITGLGLLYAPSASADWQYTKWGMSLDELLASSGAKVVRTTPKEQKDGEIDIVGRPMAKTTYVGGGITYDARFYFDGGKLTGVRLLPKSLSDALKTQSRLRSVYGEPREAKDRMVTGGGCRDIVESWHAEADGNRIHFGAHFCIKMHPWNGLQMYSVLYQPVLSKKDAGL